MSKSEAREKKMAALRLGQIGEDLVAQRYAEQGYRTLDRNWRCREGELDVIVSDGETVVFCEVKTRASARFGDPAAWVDAGKQTRLRVAAMRWLDGQRWHRRMRFDVATVVDGEITMIEDAF